MYLDLAQCNRVKKAAGFILMNVQQYSEIDNNFKEFNCSHHQEKTYKILE